VYNYETYVPRAGQMRTEAFERRYLRWVTNFTYLVPRRRKESEKNVECAGVGGVTELYKARYRSHVLRIPDNSSAKAEWKLLVKETPCTLEKEEDTETTFTESAQVK
jgi:hypothetical protein